MSTPTLGELRAAIAATLQVELPELRVYQRVVDSPNLPCVIVLPVGAGFATGLGGDDDWDFDLYVLVSKGDTTVGQDALDAYISSDGDKSIRRVIWRFDDLGIEGAEASVRAQLTTMSNYGGQIEAAGVDHIGATLRLNVAISGPS
ncbi:hypothetical protein [Actinoallomurus sp. CA-142502]|uniref:hypothetical protein n=1 Tax=Actinoallomurus sp. CA-142502 TaxID=3239885 RepID=UPI003D8FB324